MQANPIPAEKLIALKLYSLGWLDRRWMLVRLESPLREKVKVELEQLKQMKVQNPDQLLAQLSGDASEPEAEQKPQQPVIDTFGFSEPFKTAVSAFCAEGSSAPQLRNAVQQYLTDKGSRA